MAVHLAQAIARTVIEGDPATARLFITNLHRGTSEALAETKRRRLPSTDPHTLTLLTEMVEQASSLGADSDHLAALLEAAVATRDATVVSAPRSSLVWTGPEVHQSAFRETPRVIAELVDDATAQILAVTYTLRPDSFDPAATTLARLVAARGRGVAVTVVAHKSDANKNALLAAWPPGVPLPRLLTWPIPDGDEMVKLHAKILSVDDRAVLITSANLTYHGLFSNLELGVVVYGSVAGEVRRHFDRLERQGHLTEWE